jgi:hypothetical protein
MTKWLKRLGETLALGLIWATAWLPFGVLAGFVFDPDGSMDEPWPLVGVYPGFIGAVFFRVLLLIAEQGRPLAALRPRRAAAWGIGAGVLVGALPFLLADPEGGPGQFPVVAILTSIVVLSGLSAVVSAVAARRMRPPSANAV